MSQEIVKLNASFSVSNTDVITMLVVKNREALNEQKKSLIEQREELSLSVVKTAKDKWKKFFDKEVKDNKAIEAYHNLLKILNPKAKFNLGFTKNEEQIEYHVYSSFGHSNYYYNNRENEKGEFIYSINGLDVYPEFEDGDEGYKTQENFHYVSSGDGDGEGISIPLKFVFKYNVPKEVKEINRKLAEIQNLLSNESVLKEKLIAQVTENAIKQIPELSVLVNGIETLALKS